jgi:Cu+-exporting ATPase
VRLGHKVRDPLCGMSVDANSPYRLEQEGRSLRFCSENCQADYTRVLRGESVAGVEFGCVMHPEGRQDRPGECAVCGMTLVPVRTTLAGDSAQKSEGGMVRRLRAVLRL